MLKGTSPASAQMPQMSRNPLLHKYILAWPWVCCLETFSCILKPSIFVTSQYETILHFVQQGFPYSPPIKQALPLGFLISRRKKNPSSFSITLYDTGFKFTCNSSCLTQDTFIKVGTEMSKYLFIPHEKQPTYVPGIIPLSDTLL